MPRNDVEFLVDGTRCAAWHISGETDEFARPAGRPCVVAGHGLGYTRDGGLAEFAERFAQAGIDTIAFDYRHLGASDGLPRQLVSVPKQLADFRAAIRFARGIPGVDPARIVLWGWSFSTGHVVKLGGEDRTIVAVIALTPTWSGTAQLWMELRRDGPLHVAKLTAAALRDMLTAVTGQPPVLVPLAGNAGEVAVLTAPGALAALRQTAGPNGRNGIAARVLAQVPLTRPTRRIGQLRRPMLVQIADFDLNAPPASGLRGAVKARAEVRHYPCDHFDVLPGRHWHDAAAADQVTFLRRVLEPGREPRTNTEPGR